mgnify:CR=1 FL=1
MNRWVLIDYDFRDKLPKEDCEIWITRVCFTGEDGGRRWISMQMRRISSMTGQLRGWLQRMM